MRQLVIDILLKMAKMDVEAKELVAQVEALEIVVTALLRHMAQPEQQALIQSIEGALEVAGPDSQVPHQDTELLQQYLNRLLHHPRSR